MTLGYDGSTKKRFASFIKSAPVQPLKRVPLIETDASHFLNTMRHPRAGSSTNKWMRIVHNRALDLGWLLAPVLARKIWPAFRTKKGIPITLEQHRRLVEAEKDEEFARISKCFGKRAGRNRHRLLASRQHQSVHAVTNLQSPQTRKAFLG